MGLYLSVDITILVWTCCSQNRQGHIYIRGQRCRARRQGSSFEDTGCGLTAVQDPRYTVQITFIFIDFRVCDFAFAFKTFKTQNAPCV